MGSSETFYYLTDGLGSTMALTDEAGDVDTTWDYDIFGAVRGQSGSQSNDFTFAGEQTDSSTSLQYLRARSYDPEVGRFISRDRFHGTLGFPRTQNRFIYVMDNPASFIDPSGRVCESISFGLFSCGEAVDVIEDVVGEVIDQIPDLGVSTQDLKNAVVGTTLVAAGTAVLVGDVIIAPIVISEEAAACAAGALIVCIFIPHSIGLASGIAVLSVGTIYCGTDILVAGRCPEPPDFVKNAVGASR